MAKKGYRTIIIDGKGLIKKFWLFALGITIAALIAVFMKLSFSLPASAPVDEPTDGEGILASVKRISQKALNTFVTFDMRDLRTVFAEQMPVVAEVNGGGIAAMSGSSSVAAYSKKKESEAANLPTQPPEPLPENLRPISRLDLGQKTKLSGSTSKILLGNQTSFSVNIDEKLSAPRPVNLSSDGAQLLIVHTHSTESYSPDGADSYDINTGDRNTDTSKNVVAVGDAVTEIFEKRGIKTIHDRTLHDYPSYNGSYASSLQSIESIISENPSIKVVLDIHRDAIVYSDETKAAAVTEINGERCAQLMFVVGTNEGGLYHPNWGDNLTFAIQLQNKISEKYPTLMRYVNLRKERFNQHMTSGSLIIEVGTSGNSLEEAIRGASLGADVIADYLLG